MLRRAAPRDGPIHFRDGSPGYPARTRWHALRSGVPAPHRTLDEVAVCGTWACLAVCAQVTIQRSAITHQPFVAERIHKAALPVRSPRHLVGLDGTPTPVGSCGHGTSDERVGIIAKHFDSDR